MVSTSDSFFSTNNYLLRILFLLFEGTCNHYASWFHLGFPGGSDGKESACSAGDLGSTPGLGRSPGGGHGNPLQDSCLENPLNQGAWVVTVHRGAKTGLSD